MEGSATLGGEILLPVESNGRRSAGLNGHEGRSFSARARWTELKYSPPTFSTVSARSGRDPIGAPDPGVAVYGAHLAIKSGPRMPLAWGYTPDALVRAEAITELESAAERPAAGRLRWERHKMG